MARHEQVERLLARAQRLEKSLLDTLLKLDDEGIQKLANAALSFGIERDEIEDLFLRTVGSRLESAYGEFGRDTSMGFDIPLATAAVDREAATAIGSLIRELTDEAQAVIARLVTQARLQGWTVQKLAREIKSHISLTVRQNEYVDRYDAKLRRQPKETLRNELRDRRFDSRILRGDRLDESSIRRMVDRYREKWARYRALNIARQELIAASNAANYATWLDAEEKGLLPRRVRKWWVHMQDAHVRYSHVEIPIMNPNGVELDGSFVTPLGRLRYPCDPLGVAADKIGCRCVVVVDTANPRGVV